MLFLAFLKQFQHLQGDLNQLTQNHLRYYYGTRAFDYILVTWKGGKIVPVSQK